MLLHKRCFGDVALGRASSRAAAAVQADVGLHGGGLGGTPWLAGLSSWLPLAPRRRPAVGWPAQPCLTNRRPMSPFVGGLPPERRRLVEPFPKALQRLRSDDRCSPAPHCGRCRWAGLGWAAERRWAGAVWRRASMGGASRRLGQGAQGSLAWERMVDMPLVLRRGTVGASRLQPPGCRWL